MPPRLLLIGDKTIEAGQPITFKIEAEDDEGEPLSYSASGGFLLSEMDGISL